MLQGRKVKERQKDINEGGVQEGVKLCACSWEE